MRKSGRSDRDRKENGGYREGNGEEEARKIGEQEK